MTSEEGDTSAQVLLSTSEEGDTSAQVLLSTSEVPSYIDIAPGPWGDWLGEIDGPTDYLACGMALRQEKFVGDNSDDTAANAIRIIYCSIFNWKTQKEVELNTGLWGDWKDKVMCPEGFFINGAQANVQPNQQQEDDTGLNALRIRCKNPSMKQPTQTLALEYSSLGDWGGWVEYPSSYICGGQVRFEDYQGVEGDDSVLNGVRFKFCRFERVLDSTKIENNLKESKTESEIIELVQKDKINSSSEEITHTFEFSTKVVETMKWIICMNLNPEYRFTQKFWYRYRNLVNYFSMRRKR